VVFEQREVLNLHGAYEAYKRVFNLQMWPAAGHAFERDEQVSTYTILIVDRLVVPFPLMLLVFQLTKFAIGESVLHVSWKFDAAFALCHVLYTTVFYLI
jgi:hypothetical protein